MNLQIAYRGWGTFRVAPEGGPAVVIDPNLTALVGNAAARADEVLGDVLLLTHGHHEHIRDVHRVARFTASPIVAPPQVSRFLQRHRGMPARRFRTIEPDGTVRLPGLTVTARGFPHLPKHDVAGKLAVLRRDNPVGAIALSLRNLPSFAFGWQVIKHQPEGGPFLAYDLDFEGGPRVFVSCEAFTHLLDPEVPARWAAGRPIHVALVGVESGQEERAAEHAQRLGAAITVAAAVHAPFERFYGKPDVVPERFLGGRERWAFWPPGTEQAITV